MRPKLVLAGDWLLTLGPSDAWFQSGRRLQTGIRADSNLQRKTPRCPIKDGGAVVLVVNSCFSLGVLVSVFPVCGLYLPVEL
jgi:hypothetical protein